MYYLFTAMVALVPIYLYRKQFFHEEKPHFSKASCIGAFDVDNTLTLNNKQIKHYINYYNKIKDSRIVIVTARLPIIATWGIPWESLGLDESEVVVYSNWCSLCSTSTQKARHKTKQLIQIQNDFSVDKKMDICLFDDLRKNIEWAKQHGFQGIQI